VTKVRCRNEKRINKRVVFSYGLFFAHLSDSKLVGKFGVSLSIWRVTSVVSAFCNFFFFFILTYRLSTVALTSYHWVRWHPSRTILRAVGRAIERLSCLLSFVDLPVFGRRKKSARSARISAFRVYRYEGVMRYIETRDALVFFLFLASFVPNSRT